MMAVERDQIGKPPKVTGIDVWLDTGVHIEGSTKFDSKTKELAKKKLIEIINNDQCDFHWVELEEL
tara:strand:+ start:664 stop:861 length:198 start_codon:yes stop_codon:yes gene_type:complete